MTLSPSASSILPCAKQTSINHNITETGQAINRTQKKNTEQGANFPGFPDTVYNYTVSCLPPGCLLCFALTPCYYLLCCTVLPVSHVVIRCASGWTKTLRFPVALALFFPWPLVLCLFSCYSCYYSYSLPFYMQRGGVRWSIPSTYFRTKAERKPRKLVKENKSQVSRMES